MTKDEVMKELESKGNPSSKAMWMRHGAREPFFAVKIEELKKIQKKVKKDHELSLQLYETGNSDAMYLAGLIADENKITKADLNNWVKNAYYSLLSEFTVPWVASESKYGWELAKEWLESPDENIAAAGWSTFSSLASIKPDDELDVAFLSSLIDRVVERIHGSQNRVKQAMNNFIIAMGSYIPALTNKAIEAGNKIGKVTVNMGETACKTPLITEYIDKVKLRNKLGVKRKEARC